MSCPHCRRLACDESVKGLKICHVHGGSTRAQRNPLKRAEAVQQRETPLRLPGRPIIHGFYARSPRVRVRDIVEEYRQREINPDATDENMLYLHAHLELLMQSSPGLDIIDEPRRAFQEGLEDMLAEGPLIQGEITVPKIIRMVDPVTALGDLADTLSSVLGEAMKTEEELFKRHERLIRLSKVRAETRLLNSNAMQLDAFMTMLQRLLAILYEQLDPQTFAALHRRIERDLLSLAERVLTGGGVEPHR